LRIVQRSRALLVLVACELGPLFVMFAHRRNWTIYVTVNSWVRSREVYEYKIKALIIKIYRMVYIRMIRLPLNASRVRADDLICSVEL
jgi:hypothetical protein